jgi:hypothetical protein
MGDGERVMGRRSLLPAMALALAALALRPLPLRAHHHHKKRRKRCDKHCKSNHKTCDRGCDILDGDSQHFCKQSCKVALSQCKSDC